MLRSAIVVIALLVLSAPTARAEGSAFRGQKVFAIRCKACHRITKKLSLTGPHLVGVVGRKAGSLEAFRYSSDMTRKGSKGLVWTKANLRTFLKAPQQFVKGTKMGFPGLKKAEDIDDVIAYIEHATSKVGN